MDYDLALRWDPPSEWNRLVVIDSHAGGEPFRIVIDGLPEIPGTDVLTRRDYAKRNLENLRKELMWEPRGHADMYGGWLGEPVSPGADVSVLFLHNEGFSTMCGHGVIAMCKVILETGMFPSEDGERTLRIDTPAGLVEATSLIEGGTVTHTRFRNVESFVEVLDGEVRDPDRGTVRFDIGFGGAYYAVVEAAPLDLDLDDVASLIDAGRTLKSAISSTHQITHPDNESLAFLYGVIFTGPARDPSAHSRNVCVFADGEIDRSATGTGVSARLAIMHERGDVGIDQTIGVESITGSQFTGTIVEAFVRDGRPVIVPEIGGTAHITGRSEIWIDPNDTLGKGFLLR